MKMSELEKQCVWVRVVCCSNVAVKILAWACPVRLQSSFFQITKVSVWWCWASSVAASWLGAVALGKQSSS